MRVLPWALGRSVRGLTLSWLGGLGYQAGLIVLPWCLGRALDRGITPGDPAALLFWAGATLAVSVALTGAEWAMRWWATLAGVRTGNALLLRLADRVLGWDAATAHRFSAGDLVMRGTRDIEQITVWLSTVPSLASGVLGLGTVIAVVATLDPVLAMIGLATLPLLIAVNLWYPRRYERANAALSAAHGARADAVEDLLSASTAVRGLGGETALVERHHAASATVNDRTLAVARVAAGWSAHAPFVPWLATAAGVVAGGLAVLDGRFSVGGLVAFASWMALLGRQVMMLTLRFGQLGDAWTAARRLGEVLTAGPAGPGGSLRLAAAGSLSTSGLSRMDLSWPDITIAPGEFVAVTGPVGAGKSTLLRLLARLTDPDTGSVTYGCVDLRHAAEADVRNAVTLVGQRPLLLSGTVAENLRLGRDLTDAQLRDACRRAAILDHIESLPDGFDTLVGERGSTLSGGQVQRLALARGLLRNARILLLDDVTSAVDAITERHILDALNACRGAAADPSADPSAGSDSADHLPPHPSNKSEMSVVFVTSRPAVVARADRVIELGVHDGELVRRG